jgi:hypothetical protein
MAAARHFPSPSPLPSPLPSPWLSLICRLVVVLTPLPLVLSTLPPPQPLLINALPPLVRWRISSRLPLFAGWLSRRLLSRRLRLALPFVAQPPLASILDPPSSLVPAGCCVVLHLVAPPPPLDVPPAHVLPLAAPSPYIRQLALSCTAIFVTPSLGAAAIAGILKCMAHSPGGGIANGHCSLSYGSRLPTRPHACRLTCSLLWHLRLKFASSPSLAPPLSSPPLLAPWPSPASSNAGRTLPAAASPTATVPSCTALVIQHVHLCRPSSSLQLNHPPSLPNSRHILEEGDDVEAFYVCVKFTLIICESRSTVPRVHQDSPISVNFTLM